MNKKSDYFKRAEKRAKQDFENFKAQAKDFRELTKKYDRLERIEAEYIASKNLDSEVYKEYKKEYREVVKDMEMFNTILLITMINTYGQIMNSMSNKLMKEFLNTIMEYEIDPAILPRDLDRYSNQSGFNGQFEDMGYIIAAMNDDMELYKLSEKFSEYLRSENKASYWLDSDARISQNRYRPSREVTDNQIHIIAITNGAIKVAQYLESKGVDVTPEDISEYLKRRRKQLSPEEAESIVLKYATVFSDPVLRDLLPEEILEFFLF